MILFRSRTCTREAFFVGWILIGTTSPWLRAQGLLQRTGEPGAKSSTEIAKTTDDQASAAIRRKLANIIIPSIEFRSTTLEDAVEFLRQESRRLDPDPDPQSRGLNIVLRLPAGMPTSQTRSTVSSQDPLSNTPVPSTRPRITLTMNRIPLLEALKYVAIQAGLKVKIDPYAVSLVPTAENTDALITAVFRVSPTFIDNKNNGGGTSALDQAATSAH